MDISTRWYGAAGATVIAAGITARYVSKWRRRRYLRGAGPRDRGPTGSRYYVGLDLTDPFAGRTRPCDVAVLGPDLDCTFEKWDYKPDGSGIVPGRALGRSFIMAVDGPQGLAGAPGATVRESERLVNAPGRTPYDLPEPGKPYSGFIKGSVLLFYRLVTSGSRFRLLGLDDVPPSDANLIEVYPGGAWKIVSDQPLPPKRTVDGRSARVEVLSSLGITFPSSDLPTDDQLDAALAAWTAFRFAQGMAKIEGFSPEIDHAAGAVREGFVVHPLPPDAELEEPYVASV
ncbi:MAG: DUF429 domain-containing protein [Chloroflexi bacterium]|nr:DUF429 domain-containing protein [Chloroflexota bacterium]